MIDDWSLPTFDIQRCTACGVCVEKCPEEILTIDEHILKITHSEMCTYCMICEQVCPEGAIRCELEILWDKDINERL
jgi:ferredoxin